MTRQYVCYLWEDPKSFEIRYVGKGERERAFAHINRSHNPQLGRMLKKREREGFKLIPYLISAKNEKSAFMLERFWIKVFGRQDLGTGTTFNKTDGGDGVSGSIYKQTDEHKKNIGLGHKGIKFTEERRLKISKALTGKSKPGLSILKSKPCTVDGVIIYKSRRELGKILGQGKNGSKSPNFRYV